MKRSLKTLLTPRNFKYMKKLGVKLVYDVAEFSYHSGRSSQSFNISHLHHGGCKIRPESFWALAVFIDNSVCGSSTKKYLVGLKKTFPSNEILEVIVIKRIGRHQLKRCKIVITIPIISRTAASPGTGKAGINVSSIVVYPIPECHTSCLTYCMGTYVSLNELISIEPCIHMMRKDGIELHQHIYTHKNKASLDFHLPERATMSLALKPLLPNKETSLSRLSLKLGRLVAAWLRPEVVESLLPSLTVHVGPLTYLIHGEN